MHNFVKFIKKIFFLHPALTALISIPSFALVIYSLTIGSQNRILAYISYALSAYALAISCTAIYRFIMWFRENKDSSKLLHAYKTDLEFKMKLSLLPGLIINFAYVALKLASGVIYRSFWFVFLAIYYSFLIILRFSLLRHIRKDAIGENRSKEFKIAKRCGIILLLLNIVLSLILFFMVYWERGYSYPGMLIYVMAFYSFYSVTAAIVNLIKYRKYGSPVLLSWKVISLTSALVSILSLESAMLSAFGNPDDRSFRHIMTLLTGIGVIISVTAMAVFMISKSNRELSRKNKKD